jgi:hypothetical protein
MIDIFMEAKHILRYAGTRDVPQREGDWFYRETTKYELHPIVWAAMKVCRPHNWQQLLLEWPHQSVNDAARIAYTRDERAGISDKQTVTSVGKYLRRHWPDSTGMPDHTIRDLVQRYGTNSEYKLVHTMAEMLHHLASGPGSCMVWSRSGLRCADGKTRHPYEVYNPKYGWHMAVGILNGETVSRALCMDNKATGDKYYVRTYLRPTRDGEYSQVDGGLEHWLGEQGYVKKYSWQEGEKFSYHEADGTVLMPYLDGNDKTVTHGCATGEDYLYMDSSGSYLCNRTDGLANNEEDDENYFTCDDCGDRTSEDDGYWVTRSEDTHVCSSCHENYTYVYGRRGNQYYVCSDYVVYCNDEYYDEDYLDDNEIVLLENGDYESLDNAVEVSGEWYHIDDERICRTEDTDEYALREDCWQCAESGNMYTDDCTDWTEHEGERYHDDYIPAHIADATATKDEPTTTEGE